MLSVCALLLPLATATVAEPKLTIEGAPRHPTVNVMPDDVERARKRIATDPAAKAWFDSVKKSVAGWADRNPAWIREVMPEEGACFAYGFTGCPICGGRWGTWGGARASLDNPGHVTCNKKHVLPDEDYPDPGIGYVGQDKRIHYFVGSYNAWVVETLTFKIARPYAQIYLLARDDRAGRMAAVILDEIARIYPSCDKGSWDYPSNPPSGRLNRPWYQVARVLIHYVDIYDWVFDHPALDEPSSRDGLTRRENIERNLLLNGAKYCYDMSRKGGLHNGEADYLRGVLAVGVVLGIPEYVTWPVDGPFGIRAMLANNVDRDGRYFETAAGYALHTRQLYLTFAEPLINYRGSVFPDGLNLYDEPKFEAFYLLPQMATVCLGQNAPFGDAAPGFRRRSLPYTPPTVFDSKYAERLATRVSDPKKRANYAALMTYLRSRDPNAEKEMRSTAEWRVFHVPDKYPTGGTLSETMKRLIDGSFFFGQKGLAVLRRGEETSAHAAILRFGPSLNHGHYDDLNINYFAEGYEITYDIGYSLGSTHTQVGWAKQTISHNTVIVDEKSQGGGMAGGSLYHFADLQGLALAEASSTVYVHVGVNMYRRLFALTDRYALDVFRVSGGKKHDLPLHALSTEVVFDNLTFGDVQPGSLAGEQYKWGELQLNDGDMKGYPNKPYWNPPPGNGYGFLVECASAKPKGNWSATWLLEDKTDTRFRLLALEDGGSEVVTATAPGLYPTYPRARHIIRRRDGGNLSSCFVSVWQTFSSGAPAPVKSLRRIDGGTAQTAKSPMALVVALADGKRDLWCLAPTADAVVTGEDGETKVRFQGALAMCRLDGNELLSASLVNGTALEVGGWRLLLDQAQRSATVAKLTDGTNSISIDADWPADGRYDGDSLYLSSLRYSRNSVYRLSKVNGSQLEVESANTIVGQGVVHAIEKDNTLITRVPHEYARPVTRKSPSGFFKGKLLRTKDGRASTRIRGVRYGNPTAIDVDSTAGFEVGQAFEYHDVQSTDTVTVHHYVTLHRTGPRAYTLRTNTDVTVKAPDNAKVRYIDKGGKPRLAPAGRIPRANLPPNGQTTVNLQPFSEGLR